MFALVIPAKGDIAWVCPAFEEDRAHEQIRFGKDIRTWEEDESPYKRIAEILRDRGIQDGKVGIEERVRFFLYNGIKKEAPYLQYVSADPVTVGCRVIKSPAEIALMQKANDITIEAYKASIARLEKYILCRPQGPGCGWWNRSPNRRGFSQPSRQHQTHRIERGGYRPYGRGMWC
jgi:Xaa-Pro dipeptidase